ncbi:MAG: hypothetical protein EZS26_000719 [Candidatus Ordinivivax streblomastigis]|uniref:Uncharacterized protein n=1 Tax=Candidatus Ordinivivax streblomastigis TaxID=2540710 RepID=A0A5M8P463_9BACT|nr:MAG: hypothetical protein EZS26_000719 [Candidatus Ordinivivax streblomastigis]
MDTKQDDGSLSFLKIEPDKNSRHFNCPETTQQKLINLSFWVIDYLEDVKTKFGSNRLKKTLKIIAQKLIKHLQYANVLLSLPPTVIILSWAKINNYF